MSTEEHRIKIAVILTCFNRIKKTENCLNKLLESADKSQYSPDIVFSVCDDGSMDGTHEMLEQYKSVVKVVNGTGKLFWARGMAKAFENVSQEEFDFYLMVNDDVDFYDDVFDTLLGNYFDSEDKSIAIVGATQDHNSKEYTYGGYLWNGKAIKKIMKPIKPDSDNLYCNTANWNCVLLPTWIYKAVGKIDTNYEHSFADFDYSNRIIKSGFKMYVANKYVGLCNRNSEVGTWRDKSLPFKKRITLLHKPNGFPPKSSWRYARKYYGIAAPYRFIMPYVTIIKDSLKLKGTYTK